MRDNRIVRAFNVLVNEAGKVEIFFNSSRPGVFMTLGTDKGLKDYYLGKDDNGEKTIEVL